MDRQVKLAFSALMLTAGTYCAYAQDSEDQGSGLDPARVLEDKRLEFLGKRGTLAWERPEGISEFVPEPKRPLPDDWMLLSYSPVLGPSVPFAAVQTEGLSAITLPFPEPLRARLSPGMQDWVSAVALKYPRYTLMYLRDPDEIKHSALHEVKVMIHNKQITDELGSRVQAKIQTQSSLTLMRASLDLSVKEARREQPSLETAAYEYALTRAQARRTDGHVVRELSRGKRVVFCYGRRDVLCSELIGVLVYEDGCPLYEVCLCRRPVEPEEDRTDADQTEEFSHMLRSILQYGLAPDDSGADGAESDSGDSRGR